MAETDLASCPRKVLVGIPAYNVERRVENTVLKTLAQPITRVVVVDDGSTDGTPVILDRLAREQPSVSIIHQRNRGYGGTNKVILDAFLRSDADYLVVLHSDGQHDPAEMLPMLHALWRGADVVLGSRALGDMRKGGMPFYKYVGNRVLTWLENLAFNTRISSFHCGFKACSRKGAAAIPYAELTDGYHFDGQFLVAVSKRGLRLEQLPITTIYHSDGVSHLRSGAYLLEIFGFIVRYHWSRARRRLRAESRPAQS